MDIHVVRKSTLKHMIINISHVIILMRNYFQNHISYFVSQRLVTSCKYIHQWYIRLICRSAVFKHISKSGCLKDNREKNHFSVFHKLSSLNIPRGPYPITQRNKLPRPTRIYLTYMQNPTPQFYVNQFLSSFYASCLLPCQHLFIEQNYPRTIWINYQNKLGLFSVIGG